MQRLQNRLGTAAAAIVLFAANAYVCRELFWTHYLNQLGSIEGAFISIARYAAANFPDLSWFPLWYGGIPYQNSYPPLLHGIVAAVSALTTAKPALAYHAVVAAFYCGGAVAVFAMALRLSGSRAYSFYAGLCYSFLSSSAWLIADIHRDLGGYWRPRRLQTLLVYGEGPHVAGLTLLPLSILLLDIAAARRNPVWVVAAAIACAATVLTNWLAAVALAAAVVAWLICRWNRASLRTAVLAGLLGIMFAAPWIPPSTFGVIQANAKTIEGDYRRVLHTLPLYGGLLVAAGAALVAALKRVAASAAVQWSAVFSLILGVITLGYAWGNIVVLPQPHRYHTELELGIAVLLPFALKPLLDRLPRRLRIATAAVLIVALIPAAKSERRYARHLLAPVDIGTTVEYRMSRWFAENMPDRRVMAPGSVSFWLNAFAGTPQIGGGFDQGTPNFLTRVLTYVLYTSDSTGHRDAEISELWLKAFGVHAVGIGGPDSREFYKPWRNPAKFAGRLPELWREGGDVIYQIPQRSPSLAHVMTKGDLAPRTPINGIDVDPLRPYVAALDNPALPPASFLWTSRHSARIDADVASGQILSVQVTHHPGWHTSRGAIWADPLGFIAIDPQCSGPCSVTLHYDGGLEMKVAWGLFGIATLASIVWSLVWRLRSGAASSPLP